MENVNLLVITNNYPDEFHTFNSNIFVKEQINYLKSHCNNVFVISPVPFGMSYYRKRDYRDYSYDNVRVFFPKYINIPLFYYIGRKFWVARALKAIERTIIKEHIMFDIIHSHFTWPSGCIGVRLAEKYKCPAVITEHTSKTVERAINKRDKLFINALKKCDALIRVREGDSERFLNAGVQENKYHYIPNGFDPQKFYPMDKSECRKHLTLPENKKILLTVSNPYSEVKGHKYLIEAMRLLSNETNDLICIIIGDGKLRPKLARLISKYRLEDKVFMVGKKPHGELVYWLNAADIFVLPSLRESFGVVQIEAMACGKPVVATYNGGSEEIIINDDLGILCKAGNAELLTQALHKGLIETWNSNAICDYVKTYHWENISKQIVSLYSHILDDACF